MSERPKLPEGATAWILGRFVIVKPTTVDWSWQVRDWCAENGLVAAGATYPSKKDAPALYTVIGARDINEVVDLGVELETLERWFAEVGPESPERIDYWEELDSNGDEG